MRSPVYFAGNCNQADQHQTRTSMSRAPVCSHVLPVLRRLSIKLIRVPIYDLDRFERLACAWFRFASDNGRIEKGWRKSEERPKRSFYSGVVARCGSQWFGWGNGPVPFLSSESWRLVSYSILEWSKNPQESCHVFPLVLFLFVYFIFVVAFLTPSPSSLTKPGYK